MRERVKLLNRVENVVVQGKIVGFEILSAWCQKTSVCRKVLPMFLCIF